MSGGNVGATLCMAVSFPLLLYSQVRMIIHSPWFLAYTPFALLGCCASCSRWLSTG